VPLAYCLTGFLSIYVLFELFGVFNRIIDRFLNIGIVDYNIVHNRISRGISIHRLCTISLILLGNIDIHIVK